MAERKYYLLSFFCLLLTSLSTPSKAQKKYEREYRIKSEAVPENARKFISSVFKDTKVGWYEEESLTGKSIEAKLKHSGKRYSIEFGESGEIQDVEILTSMKQMDSKARSVLKDSLSHIFSKYKVTKTQLHWKGKEAKLRDALLSDRVPDGVVTRYELVIRAKKAEKNGYFEILCESNGTIVSISEIVQRNADNLIY